MNFFLEIGVENLPSNLLNFTLENFKRNLKNDYIDFSVCGTYRRLIAFAHFDIKTIERTVEILGPPYELCYKDGNSSEVYKKFVDNNRISSTKTVLKKNRKYVLGIRDESLNIEEFIISLIQKSLNINFNTMMVWSGIKFIRPIRYITAFIESKMLGFELGELSSSNFIIIKHKKISIESYDDYILKIKELTINVEDRVKSLSSFDNEILENVANSLENPTTVVCHFQKRALELPRKIIERTIVTHQSGSLLDGNSFVVACEKWNDKALVKQGHEKVVESRLKDAALFYEKDITKSIEEFVDDLKDINLGNKSVFEKQQILSELSLEYNLSSDTVYAASICKFDLATAVIKEKEYGELRGYIAKEYALKKALSKNITNILEEHYFPRFINDKLPTTKEAAFLSILDKAYNIVALPTPTGAKDPFYLRRDALGILTLIKHFEFNINIMDIFRSVSLKIGKNIDDIEPFMRSRINNLAFDKSIINATIDYWSNYLDFLERVTALSNIDLNEISLVYSRLKNISKKGICDFTKLNTLEKDLYDTATEIYKLKYHDALYKILSLKDKLEIFFDKIVVMVDDIQIKRNRQALLYYVQEAMNRVGNLEKIFRG